MKLIYRFLMVAFAVITTPAHAGSSAHGGGSAEHNFSYALANLDRYIDLALATGGSRFSSEELSLLRSIENSLSRENRNHLLLQFQSESEKPGTFMIDGATRVAFTNSNVGDAIFINVDLIYILSGNKIVAMEIPDCVAILIHEFGHHHGEWSHEKLDRLGAKVQTLIEKQLTMSRFDPVLSPSGGDISAIKDFPELISVDLSSDFSKSFDSRLYLADSFGTYDVTGNIMAGIRMNGDHGGPPGYPLSTPPCFGSDFLNSKKIGWKFNQFHFSGARWSYAVSVNPALYVLQVGASLSVECIDPAGNRLVYPGIDALYLVVVQIEGDKSRIVQLDAPGAESLLLLFDDNRYNVTNLLQQRLQQLYPQK